MTPEDHIVELRTSPHLKQATTVPEIMRNVVYALLPICAFSVYAFGLSALASIALAVSACLLTEHAACKLSGGKTAINDFSAVISGILLALTLPPGFPLWMTFLGGVFGIAVAKSLFGGIGFNLFNPALVGRAFLQAAFPVAITTWTPPHATGRFSEFIPTTMAFPFTTPKPVSEWIAALDINGFSGATPLALQKFESVSTSISSLFLGGTAGSLGETSAVLILLGGAYLVYRKMMDWRVPAAMLLGAVLTGLVFFVMDSESNPNPVFILFSGGLMLGAVFMASDMVASPVTPLGVWIYGLFMGFITVLIRVKGGLPEGVMYAILLGNALSPIIESLTQPRIYGARKRQPKNVS